MEISISARSPEQGSTASLTCVAPQNKAVLVSVDAGTSDYSDLTVKTKTPGELLRTVGKDLESCLKI